MKTSLSAGMMIRALLTGDAGVMGIARKVFPVITDSAELPYVVYRRLSLEQSSTKAGMPGADTVRMEVLCYAGSYQCSVELAEAVRAALDYKKGVAGGLQMRSCTLEGGSESFEGDAYLQELVFNIKI